MSQELFEERLKFYKRKKFTLPSKPKCYESDLDWIDYCILSNHTLFDMKKVRFYCYDCVDAYREEANKEGLCSYGSVKTHLHG